MSTLQSGNSMHLHKCSRYVYPSPLMFRRNASCDISYLIAPGWKVIVFELAKLAARPIRRNILMRAFRVPYIHCGSQDPSIKSSSYNTTKLWPSMFTSPPWTTDPSSTISKSQFLTVLLTATLNSMCNSNPPEWCRGLP